MKAPCFFAKFIEIEGVLLRKNTRIYPIPSEQRKGKGRCLGAWFLKNPGAAVPGKLGLNHWGPLDLGSDKALPVMLKIFVDAAQRAGFRILADDYIQILNLHYVCDPDKKAALNVFQKVKDAMWFEDPHQDCLFLTFGWGSEPELNLLRLNAIEKIRNNLQSGLLSECEFFWPENEPQGRISIRKGIPGLADHPRHPVRAPSEYGALMREHLAKILKKSLK